MTRGRVLAIAVAVALSGVSCAHDANDSAGLVDSAVQIDTQACGAGRGSGVAVAPDLVVTAAHTVAGSLDVLVTTNRDRQLVGIPVVVDTELDVAVVRVDGLDAAPLRVGSTRVRTVSAALLPLRDEIIRPTDLRRVVWANTTDIYRRIDVVKLALELDIDIDPGDSGAAVVDHNGALVGIIVSSSSDRPVAFAVHIEEIIPLVDDATTRFEAQVTECWK